MDSTENKGVYKRMSWPELRERAKGNWAAIFEDLAKPLAEAIAHAPEHVPCPVHGGSNGYRLFEHYNETGRGICNTCGAQKSGFETLAWVKGYTFKDAVREVGQWVRSETSRPPRVHKPPMPLAPRIDPAVAYRNICGVWRTTEPLAGSAAERYLAARGIWVQNMPSTLRAHPGLSYFDKTSKSSIGKFPCLVAPIKDKEGKLVSLHRIYLTPEGLKAPVPEVKKMMSACGELRGSAIKLFPPGKVLAVAEGIETALAVHAISRLPVWSCVSAVLMEQVDIPESVEHVIIWADLDNSQRGLIAADTLADRLEAQGKTVEVCVPQGPIPDGSKGIDWLDVMLTRGVNGFPAKWRRWRPDMAV